MATAKGLTAVGRRKEASARVFLRPAEVKGEGAIVVNGRGVSEYFKHYLLQTAVNKPLQLTEREGSYELRIRVIGGGSSGQAGAVAHGISRALEIAEPELRPVLKKAGLLTRDARVVERKKPGRHKARKRPQFSKR